MQPIPPFQAKWELPLQPEPAHCCTRQKIAQTLLFPIAALARKLLLPAASTPPEEVQMAKRQLESYHVPPRFQLERHTVLTPDQAKIQVTFFRSLAGGPNTPTVIGFNPNAVLSDQLVYEDLLLDQRTPCHFVFFDYRGVGLSTGKFRSMKDLVVDGASVVQWVKKTLKTSPEQIHFYGRSLGGIVATQVKALNPEATPGRFVHERSGSSMRDFIEAAFPARHKIVRVFLSILQSILQWMGLSFDVTPHLDKLVGRTMIVYHPNDQIFPYAASLARHATAEKHEILPLELPPHLAYLPNQENPHNDSLFRFNDSVTKQPAAGRVHNFLFALA